MQCSNVTSVTMISYNWHCALNGQYNVYQPNVRESYLRHARFEHILTFGTGVLHLIQINQQPDATVFQFIILTFVYSSTYFGRFPAHHKELNDCSGSLWFYLRIVVIVVLCSWSGRPAGRPAVRIIN
jgi:hypothetical protein